MEHAEIIRQAVASIAELQADSKTHSALSKAVSAVKQFQAQRFRVTYADLLPTSNFGPAANFFLQELYSDKDFSERDVQFGRIAGALQTLFPQQVVKTAVSLAQLHRLTEELDHDMAKAILSASTSGDDGVDYARAWNKVGRPLDREQQLQTVLTVGAELDRLTRAPGLRIMLRMMRRPANAAGLGALQRFLEAGFDTFAAMTGKQQLASYFLATIKSREHQLISSLFAIDSQEDTQSVASRLPVACHRDKSNRTFFS